MGVEVIFAIAGVVCLVYAIVGKSVKFGVKDVVIDVQEELQTWQRTAITILGIAFLVVALRSTFGPQPLPPTAEPINQASLMPLQTINFDYLEPPTDHGWELIDTTSPPIFTPITDTIVGNALSVNPTAWYAIDYSVSRAAQLGEVIELVIDFQNDAAFYAYVTLEHPNKPDSTGWLKFMSGRGTPRKVTTDTNAGQGEWELNIQPTSSMGDQWFLYQIDLEDAVKQTFGKNGWCLLRLNEIRVRGQVRLSSITILTTEK